MDGDGPGPARGQGDGPARASAGVALTLTADRASLARLGALAAALRDEGYVVESRAFIETGPDAGPIILVGLDRPLPDVVALVAPPATRPRVVGTLAALLFPGDSAVGSATLQLKARGAFVSAPVADRGELARALEALPAMAARPDTSLAHRRGSDPERRVVYAAGVWHADA